jgi:hypothetical protein
MGRLVNHHRLYEYCGDISPVEMETAHYAQTQRTSHWLSTQIRKSPDSPGRFTMRLGGAAAGLRGEEFLYCYQARPSLHGAPPTTGSFRLAPKPTINSPKGPTAV